MKIAFTDFWLDFDPENNFFTDLFRAIYGNVHVSHPSDSEVLFIFLECILCLCGLIK